MLDSLPACLLQASNDWLRCMPQARPRSPLLQIMLDTASIVQTIPFFCNGIDPQLQFCVGPYLDVNHIAIVYG